MSFPFLSPFFFSFFPWLSSFSTSHPSLTHSLTHCWDSSSKRFHGHWHRKRALLASLQQNSKLSHHFRPGPIYLLLSDTVFLTHIHDPDPGFPDTHFMQQKPSWTQPLLVNQGPTRRRSPPYLMHIVISFFFFFSFLLYGYWIFDFWLWIMDFEFH